MTMVCATPYRPPVIKPPIETGLQPRYGVGRLETYTNPQLLDIALSNVHENPLNLPQFTLPPIDETLYYYYACPVEYGFATFRDPSGFQGGWDGASWPVDDIGDEYGPVEITYLGAQWYVYRTDFPSAPGGTYTVTFANG
jgi:hypothetical protein